MRCSPATAAAPRACAGCSSTSSSATSTSPATIPSTPPSACERAEELYEKVFVEYGDDSVAQLGGVHLACEQASNVLTKVLEWGRLTSYLEQSTRYIAYDARLGGRYRFYRDPAVLGEPPRHPLRRRHGPPVRRLQPVLGAVTDHVRATVERHPDDSDFVYRQATRAKALDAARGMLPAAALSNVGIYASGQAFEALLLRHARPSAARGARLRRADAARAAQGDPELPAAGRRRRPRRALERRTSRRPASARPSSSSRCSPMTPRRRPSRSPSSTWIRTARTSCSRRSVTRTRTSPSTSCSTRSLASAPPSASLSCAPTSASGTTAGTSRGGRSSASTTASTCSSDYGAFRDLQRHRLLTIEWQSLTPHHGYVRPELVDEAGQAAAFDEAMQRSGRLYDALHGRVPGSRRPTQWRWRTASAT